MSEFRGHWIIGFFSPKDSNPALQHIDKEDRKNAICPADVMTPILEYQSKTYGKGDPEAYYRRLLAYYPQGEKARFVEANEVAEFIFFLASDGAQPITGAALPVDFGTTAGASSREFRNLKDVL